MQSSEKYLALQDLPESVLDEPCCVSQHAEDTVSVWCLLRSVCGGLRYVVI